MSDPLEEYDELLATGGAPDPVTFAARYPGKPQLLAQLRALVAVHGDVDALAQTLAPRYPSEVGGYELEELVGEGGMGAVFRATSPGGERVAVKLLRARSQSAERRFAREAELSQQLSHPAVARVLAFGIEGDTHYLVSEWAPGRSVAALLAERRPLPHALAIAKAAAAALAHAHARGVVHRDVKPSNVMVAPSGAVKLVDFGVGKSLYDGGGERLTLTGVFVGTYDYAPPEQLRGEPEAAGPWSDVFALGAMLFEMLTGALPFVGVSPSLRSLQSHTAPSARELVPTVSRRLDAVVRRALEHKPRARFDTGAAMYAALDRCKR